MTPVPPAAAAEPIRLSVGDYQASVSPVGAALAALTYRGLDLVLPGAGDPPRPLFRGAVLAPWPNRIADGRYTFRGHRFQLPVNEVDRQCALHGLVAWTAWMTLEAEADRLTLATTIHPQPGYPHRVHVRAEYVLHAERGLTIAVTGRTLSPGAAPWGVSIHPYLVAGPGRVDDWTLHLHAAQFLEVDPERLLPRGRRAVDGTRFDFRQPRPIGATELDHAFTGIGFDGTGWAAATVTPGDRSARHGGVRMTWDSDCRWVQVHTTDLPGDRDHHRSGLALEPMTCPPDAFNSGDDVIALPSGHENTTVWHIEALG
ncbi:aldose 1-epimerase family protein [Peterkaempfera sp. SMS 1(5)a]|uniref:aldose 1-epimerase family protein n=1 Tax=Peterkaempfera podocarpi TaxID=3232308 RepID=UPI0036732F32